MRAGRYVPLLAGDQPNENRMNKSQLVAQVALSADISKATADRAVTAVFGHIRRALRKGEAVTLVGFGSFSTKKRAARVGRNPRTGAAINIKAKKVPHFRPGADLRKAVD